MMPIRIFRSLQFRITAVALVLVFLVLSLTAVALVGFLERELLAQTDGTLLADSDFIRKTIVSDAARPDGAPADLYVQVVAKDGSVLGGTEPATGRPPLVNLADVDPRGGRQLSTVEIPGGGTFRVLAEPFEEPPVVLLIGRPAGQVGEATSSLARLLVFGIPLLTAALGLLIWIVVGRALRPVEAVRAEVDEISDEDLSRRVPVPDTGDELERLVETMNEMLDRLEAAVDRERRLVADASHELRSPLAGVRALLETEPTDPEAAASSRAEALAAVDRLQSIIDDLLVLARLDSSEADCRSRPVDLDELVLQQADHLRRVTDLTIDTSGVSGGQVSGHDADLGRVVENLSSNATRHAKQRVTFGVVEHDGWVEVAVADDGPGVPEADRQRIFERFTRLDDARTRQEGGAGLGLAIAATIVREHAGSIRVEDAAGGGARFVVELPTSQRAVPVS